MAESCCQHGWRWNSKAVWLAGSALVESAQFVGRVARLSRNVRQPDYIPAHAVAGHKAEPRPGADEQRLAMTKDDGMEVESILINQTKVGQAPCQVRSGYVDLPIQLGLQLADYGLEVLLDECGVGPTDFNERDTTHFR